MFDAKITSSHLCLSSQNKTGRSGLWVIRLSIQRSNPPHASSHLVTHHIIIAQVTSCQQCSMIPQPTPAASRTGSSSSMVRAGKLPLNKSRSQPTPRRHRHQLTTRRQAILPIPEGALPPIDDQAVSSYIANLGDHYTYPYPHIVELWMSVSHVL